jgi:hypothetical protein
MAEGAGPQAQGSQAMEGVMSDIRETVRHMLANLFHVRLVDVTDEDLHAFATELDYHNLVLIDKSGRFK